MTAKILLIVQSNGSTPPKIPPNNMTLSAFQN